MNESIGNVLRHLWIMACLAWTMMAGDPTVVFETDFEKEELGKPPSGFMVLDGGFAVREDNGNRFLELPGAPLETYGCLFGPAHRTNVAAVAKVSSTGKGRRFPTLAVGLNGVSGYKLQLAPGKKTLELRRGDTLKASIPFEWASGRWYWLRLDLREEKPGSWRVEGRVWQADSPEPAQANITCTDTEEPPPGRASVWGSPFAGTPILYDDLRVLILSKPSS